MSALPHCQVGDKQDELMSGIKKFLALSHVPTCDCYFENVYHSTQTTDISDSNVRNAYRDILSPEIHALQTAMYQWGFRFGGWKLPKS
jgi:hypothetical protein